MARLPPRSTREVEELLQHCGFRFDRVGRYHHVWVHESKRTEVSVPRNRASGGIPVGTLVGILRLAGIQRSTALTFWGIH